MPLHNPLLDFDFQGLFSTLLPDFVLAFTFFTALIYAVLGRRLGHQRPAIAISAALGLALSAGLVWWEQVNDLSIKNLGPIAAGFAIIVLAGVIYQSIKGIGGSWAGAGIAIGACILVGWFVGIDWRLDTQVVQSVVTVTLVVGAMAFLLHRRGFHSHGGLLGGRTARKDYQDVRHDMSDLYEDRRIADRVVKGFRRLRRKVSTLDEHPNQAGDIMLQLRRMLPAEGWLTERMARLREKAHRIRVGHVARIEDIQAHIAKLSPVERRRVASELSARYRELKLDLRIERLDKAVAACEMRIRQLTQQAQVHLANHDHKKLVDVLEVAKKLQHHNAKLLKTISQTETRLLRTAKHVAQKSGGVKPT